MDGLKKRFQLDLEGGGKPVVTLLTDREYAISWEGHASLPNGWAPLYNYPSVTLDTPVAAKAGTQDAPPTDYSGALCTMIVAMAKQEPESIENVEDALGAKLMHALLLANTTASCDLALELATARPKLLLGTTAEHSEKTDYKGQGWAPSQELNPLRHAMRP